MNEITQDNFDQYFFDIRKHLPQKGQVLARYTAMADFIASNEKKNVIDLISTTDKVEAASQVMRKLHFAAEEDSYRVLQQICEDLLNGMTEQEVLEKPYRYKIEVFYYVSPEHVPKDDPHWDSFGLLPSGVFKEI